MVTQDSQATATPAIQVNESMSIIPGGRKSATQAVVKCGEKTLRVSID